MAAWRQILLALVSFGLAIAATLSPSPSPPSIALYVLLPSIFVFSTASAFLERLIHSSITKCTGESDVGVALLALVQQGLDLSSAASSFLVAPGISLSLLLFVRLVSKDHFVTHPASLDFGPKEGDPTFQNPNLAFEAEFVTFGHWVQGFLASLLAHPSVSGYLSRLCQGGHRPLSLAEPRLWILVLVEFSSYCFAIYPTYNFVKRMAKTPQTFATSSYMNNGAEWAFGCITGLSVGMLLTSVTKRNIVTRRLHESSDQTDEGTHAFGKRNDFQDPISWCAKLCLGLGHLLGICFVVSVFGAAAMTGYTWNTCKDDATTCVNYSSEQQVSMSIVVGLLIIPTCICGASMYRQIVQRRNDFH